MNYPNLFKYIDEFFDSNIQASLTYHQKWHTMEVVKGAEIYGRMENFSEEEILLVKSAALMHDMGYVNGQLGHEERSCQYARDILPDYEYGTTQIDAICNMIMATKMPQNPKDKMSEVICDADFYYLGEKDYEKKADLLFKEMQNLGRIDSKADWLSQQKDFLVSHRYFTQAAKDRQGQGKLRNLIAIEHKLANKSTPIKMFKDLVTVIFGVIIAAFALQKFLVPNHFFDGGVTGMSLLVHELYHFNLPITIFLLNLPFIVIAYFTVGKSFAGKTLLATFLLGISLYLFHPESLTQDKLLISIFGGAFLGLGIGLVMRTGSALDGIEVFALYTLKKTSFTISEIILGLNTLIFTIAAFYFGIETALYSILTYFVASRSIDYVVEGLQSYTGVTIISGQSEEVKDRLVNTLGRGITIYKGERGFLPGKFSEKEDCDIIFTVITRLELRKLTNIVSEIDAKAFIFASTIREASGGVLKKIHRH